MSNLIPQLAVFGGGGGVTPATAGKLLLVERKLVTADVTSVTFSGLDGDTHERYMLVVALKTPGGGTGANIDLRPNGLTTNQGWTFWQTDGGADSRATGTGGIRISSGATTGVFVHGSTLIEASKAYNGVARRRLFLTTNMEPFGAATQKRQESAGQWNETATNLTSLDVVSSLAAGIQNGSLLTLYRLAP